MEFEAFLTKKLGNVNIGRQYVLQTFLPCRYSLDEETGERSYTLPFLLAGGFLVVASLISSSIHVLQFREAKKHEYIKDKNTAVTVDKL